jgi:LuxR family maltose regulon positive regulatory protein
MSQQEKLCFKTVISVEQSLGLPQKSEWIRRDPLRDIMFLIDSHGFEMTRLELITDKIAPPARTPRVSRSRLLSTLERSMAAGTSTIISGRAGTGKTSLALDFAQKCGRPVAWYKIDAPDADPHVFFHYLVGSIQGYRLGFGRKLLMALLKMGSIDLIDRLADAFVYELAESETAGPLLIVIEDLHLVSDSDWLVPFFTRLLPLLPSEVHVLITSRSLPPAPLWRMRSKQSLVVIDESALAFSRSEAVALFETYGLSPEQASIALYHTHGRAGVLDESAAFLQRSESKSRKFGESGNGKAQAIREG